VSNEALEVEHKLSFVLCSCMADGESGGPVLREIRDVYHELEAKQIEVRERCDRLLEHARNLEELNRLRRQRLAEYKVGAHFTSFPSIAPVAPSLGAAMFVNIRQLNLSNF
jgi:hypothetical protein